MQLLVRIPCRWCAQGLHYAWRIKFANWSVHQLIIYNQLFIPRTGNLRLIICRLLACWFAHYVRGRKILPVQESQNRGSRWLHQCVKDDSTSTIRWTRRRNRIPGLCSRSYHYHERDVRMVWLMRTESNLQTVEAIGLSFFSQKVARNAKSE